MDESVKNITLSREWVGQPLVTRTQGEALGIQMGLTPDTSLEVNILEGVVAVGGFWLGLCERILEGCSTLAEAYTRIRLVEATPYQRVEFERAICRGMRKVYTVSD